VGVLLLLLLAFLLLALLLLLQTWLLFVLLSVVSMAMGFYDLWKNVPYFKQVVVSMFRPAAAVFEWLEGHTQVWWRERQLQQGLV
jgi:4-hydroxybenzoate polyprenyltransferase